jgi:hypothetical protein
MEARLAGALSNVKSTKIDVNREVLRSACSTFTILYLKYMPIQSRNSIELTRKNSEDK